jgi:hypothetical protein
LQDRRPIAASGLLALAGLLAASGPPADFVGKRLFSARQARTGLSPGQVWEGRSFRERPSRRLFFADFFREILTPLSFIPYTPPPADRTRRRRTMMVQTKSITLAAGVLAGGLALGCSASAADAQCYIDSYRAPSAYFGLHGGGYSSHRYQHRSRSYPRYHRNHHYRRGYDYGYSHRRHHDYGHRRHYRSRSYNRCW